MSDGIAQNIEDYFSDLKAPRVEGLCDHKLLNTVTIDLMRCQKDIAQGIRNAKADYLLDATFREENCQIRSGDAP